MRHLVEVDMDGYRRWQCSECQWVFKMDGMPEGDTLAEMIANFMAAMERAFTEHECTK